MNRSLLLHRKGYIAVEPPPRSCKMLIYFQAFRVEALLVNVSRCLAALQAQPAQHLTGM